MHTPREALHAYMAQLPTVDCHEHLPLETERLGCDIDVLTLLASYAWVDMHSAGRPSREGETWGRGNICRDTSIPLDERWDEIWPYLKRIKYGSYFRPTAIALRDIYGIDDLNEDTYRDASLRMAAANTAGLYVRILRDRCGIETCLTQTDRVREVKAQRPVGLYAPTYPAADLYRLEDTDRIAALHQQAGEEVAGLDLYLEVLERHLSDVRDQGAVAIKIGTEQPVLPDMANARASYLEVMDGSAPDEVLKATVLDFILRKAAEWDWPVAVHTGVWDILRMDPKLTIHLIERHPGVRFELYHLGFPNARECTFMAKGYPNAFLNLSWCYVGSEEMTRRSIGEIIDAVPANKVFAFGADYSLDVENIYGHLVMARETLARVLADRIACDRLDMDGAKEIAQLWLHDNPYEFHGLATTVS